ncbi:hypothetical protein GIB67_036131 [Kingdonia uniflora]|uniref:NADP-dependent oxidoreductase domain-containing protein n=1 Tax=Kingdonia uniflora TaxID=39325 RepID=A0A7J7N8W2_9MAGN|nr:hypothetical protein GIB67_036131 [Kingdonia uniflora]
MSSIPQVTLNSGHRMPLIGLGTAVYPFGEPQDVKLAIMNAIKLGYRHFDTAVIYQVEQFVGEAITEALQLGIIKSRDELFITSKLWCSDAHHDRVLPALKMTLKSLQLEYLDLYLLHWPLSSKPGKYEYPIPKEELLPMDFKSVWEAMEECQALGLVKSIGVSNFSSKKLEQMLSFAKIPPAVNQVEMNPIWQQKRLLEFCKAKGVTVTAYSTLGAKGASWGSNRVMDSKVLKRIAEVIGKTHAQVCLRWAYEQGVCVLVKSFNEGRMQENKEIFDWALSEEDTKKISQLPQSKATRGFISDKGPFKSEEEFWDGEI